MPRLGELSAAFVIFNLIRAVQGDDEASTSVSPGHFVPPASPAQVDWASFNRTVNGRLAAGIPWTEPCFTTYNGKNATQDLTQCEFVQENFFDHCAYHLAFMPL